MKRYLLSLFVLTLYACSSRTGRPASAPEKVSATDPQPSPNEQITPPPTVEDTVLCQIGGKLYFLDFVPTDSSSITVIRTTHLPSSGDESPYREYAFINHSHHSPGHRHFEASLLDSTYKECYAAYNSLSRLPDTLRAERIDPKIREFCGYWANLTEHDGDYYLDNWMCQSTFCLTDSLYTEYFMEGYPHPIRDAKPLSDGLQIRYGQENSLRIELLDPERQLYRITDDNGRHFATPAASIHNFKIIEYCNNTGDALL